MSFIELEGMNDLKEPTLAPDGEYALMITSAELKDSRNSPGRGVIHCRIEFEDHDDYQSFMHWVALPSRQLDIDQNPDGPEEGQKKYNRMMLGVKRFLTLFNVPMENGFNVEELSGARTVAGVTQEAREDDESQINQRLVVPRVKE